VTHLYLKRPNLKYAPDFMMADHCFWWPHWYWTTAPTSLNFLHFFLLQVTRWIFLVVYAPTIVAAAVAWYYF